MAAIRVWFYGFKHAPEIMTKLISLKSGFLGVGLMMYSVSYFCTNMHNFKAKIQKKFTTPILAFIHSFVYPYWPPVMKFLATARLRMLNEWWMFCDAVDWRNPPSKKQRKRAMSMAANSNVNTSSAVNSNMKQDHKSEWRTAAKARSRCGHDFSATVVCLNDRCSPMIALAASLSVSIYMCF